ncbi:hypothetical protein BGZ95_000627 [Linnemannia exigua]|uniref:RNI-like protein n=1 Tax=Linnemannia exigua TaxID=604196 RepID=A0AAD4H5I3_9FUNG|nr:hypothetical protein BGZ95_000627 [Linnemannia exigua]
MDHCPGLCRLTLSECHGITDRSLELIRDSACISDKGLIPLLKQCGSRLVQLRVSDCDNITSASVVALANHCPNIQWLDLCRTGVLTEECLIQLAERCTELEWLNLARTSPQLETTPSTGPDNAPTGENNNENNNNNNHDNDENDQGDGDIAEDGGVEIGWEEEELQQQQEEEEEVVEEVEADDEKAFMASTSTQLVQDDHNTTSMDNTDHDDDNNNNDNNNNNNNAKVKEDSITDRALALLCESCPKLQLLDLSYISTISNTAMESLSETAKSLVCLTIIGCPGITSQSLLYLAKLRNTSGKLGCITMGDALGISERDIEAIMQGTLSGWQKSLVDETNLGEILGRSWDE